MPFFVSLTLKVVENLDTADEAPVLLTTFSCNVSKITNPQSTKATPYGLS